MGKEIEGSLQQVLDEQKSNRFDMESSVAEEITQLALDQLELDDASREVLEKALLSHYGAKKMAAYGAKITS